MRWKTDVKGVALGLTAIAIIASIGPAGRISAHPALNEVPVADPSPVLGPLLRDMPVKIGKPYTVRGTTYAPDDDRGYDHVGYASWYGEELSGSRTASGEIFDPSAISAAHRTLPLPSYVEVTALNTGRTIIVRVNDRGPFTNRHLIDLSRGAAEQLGISGHGAVPVRVRRVAPPEEERNRLRAGLPATERVRTPEDILLALRDNLGKPSGSPVRLPAIEEVAPMMEPPPASPAQKNSGLLSARLPGTDPAIPALPQGKAYVVQIAAFASESRARDAARRANAFLSGADGVWRVRTGPYADATSALNAVKNAAASGFNGARIMIND